MPAATTTACATSERPLRPGSPTSRTDADPHGGRTGSATSSPAATPNAAAIISHAKLAGLPWATGAGPCASINTHQSLPYRLNWQRLLAAAALLIGLACLRHILTPRARLPYRAAPCRLACALRRRAPPRRALRACAAAPPIGHNGISAYIKRKIQGHLVAFIRQVREALAARAPGAA